jgi:hypothetical protein
MTLVLSEGGWNTPKVALPCGWLKPWGGSPRGGLTHDGEHPGVSKPSEGKATDTESMGGHGMGKESSGGRTPGAASVRD